MNRVFTIPQGLETAIRAELAKLKVQLTDAKVIAEAVKWLSDFYIENPKAPTPWEEHKTQVAYFAYYLPLNFLRSEAIFHELKRLGFYQGLEHCIDFGAGLGSGTLPLWAPGALKSYEFIEHSLSAQKLHESFLQHFGKRYQSQWKTMAGSPKTKNALAVFSYSLTELDKIPPWTLDLEALVIIEPSTQEDGRSLLKLREELLKRGFQAWAPCTHQLNCPLLHESKNDWCHDRIHFDQPEWFQRIETLLPMKNRTLTMSYLALRKTAAPDLSHYARLTGDQLVEKGKTRQLFCRGEKREFFAWLHRNGEVQDLPRGALVEMPLQAEHKSNELRVNQEIKLKI